ncbi:uncharacterized protein LOC101894231 isoform X3 [Musca domestica]|uniref:Uncharacterized protein LOC101894231 isoform X3 n=1 Tax=Musca domestica TaxID=7370 RepID=A0A9J7DID4_MUSDO|nr:uncharacterized protein LOC101894231 isoform X3 [Musca domestica]
MAAINPEDLEKLKKFIDFVSANPLILNVPQLGFMKRFIEKFGGKVPEGEYQMPAGGKCPFGGDAKTETKTQPPPSSTQDADEAEPVVEEESEESEVELDMEETSHVQLLEPNVLYLDEKPPKIIKMARTKKRRERTTKSKVVAKKPSRGRVEKSKLKNKSTAAKKTQSCEPDKNYDDPLYSSGEKEIKMEIEKSRGKEKEEIYGIENEVKLEEDLERVATIPEDDEEEFVLKSEPENDEEYEYHNLEKEEDEEEGDSDNGEDSREEYEDDEPLIKLTRRKGRPRKYALQFTDNGDKRPGLALCRDICKQKCSQKFSEAIRLQMCRTFWSLSEDQKVEFVRRHTKTKRYVRLKRNRSKMRGNNFCYYLDECSNREEDKDDDEGGGGVEETNITRVCRKYFESTLCLTNYTIKKALEGYTPQVEEKTTTSAASQEDREERETQNNSKEPEQYLDAETGDLITIDPKAGKQGKAKKETPNCDDPETPKKKQRVRLKPGEKRLHNPKPIKCAERCIHKCHTKFSEEERQQICNVFWSLDYNRRKDFILARIETREVETERAPEFRKSNRPPRAYHTRFFLRSPKSNENIRVCKHFMMATLSIARTFITNAIDYADKNTGCYTGCDRRGLNSTPKRVSPDRMQLIKDHIGSYPTWIPHKKSKTRYLHHMLSIKRMYEEYRELCEAQQRKFVSTNMYYKTFHEEFRLSFLSNPVPKRGGGFLKANPNVSHYTGEEPGGMWLDPQGDKLDVGLHNPAQSFMVVPRTSKMPEKIPTNIDLSVSSSATTTATTKSENVPTATTSLVPPLHPPSQTSFCFNQTFINYGHWTEPMLNPSNLVGPPAAVQQEFNSNLYENSQPQPAHTSSLGSLFRKL